MQIIRSGPKYSIPNKLFLKLKLGTSIYFNSIDIKFKKYIK